MMIIIIMIVMMMMMMMINAKAVLVYMDTYTCSSLHTTKRQLEALATANRYFFEECKCNDSKDILRIIDQKKYFWQILSTKNVCKLLFQCDQQICSISTDELITSNQISSNHISWQIWSQISTSYLPKPCHRQRWSVGHSWSSSHKAGSHRDPCCPLAAPWWTPITWWWWWYFQDMCICVSVTFHMNLCFNIVPCQYCLNRICLPPQDCLNFICLNYIYLSPLKIARPGAVDLQARGYHLYYHHHYHRHHHHHHLCTCGCDGVPDPIEAHCSVASLHKHFIKIIVTIILLVLSPSPTLSTYPSLHW